MNEKKMNIFEDEGENGNKEEDSQQRVIFYDNSENEIRLGQLEARVKELKEFMQRTGVNGNLAQQLKELQGEVSRCRTEINKLNKKIENSPAECLDDVRKAFESAASKLIKQAQELSERAERDAEKILGKFGKFRYWIVGAVLSGLCIATGGVWYVARETQTVDIVRVSNELEKARQENKQLKEKIEKYEGEIKKTIRESEEGLERKLEEKTSDIGNKVKSIEQEIKGANKAMDGYGTRIEQQGTTINELARDIQENKEKYEQLARIGSELNNRLKRLEILIGDYQRKEDAEENYALIKEEIKKQQELLTKYRKTFDEARDETKRGYEEIVKRYEGRYSEMLDKLGKMEGRVNELWKKAEDNESQIKKIKERQ